MGLRMKILLGFFILSLMLLVAGVVSIYELESIGSSVQGLLDDNYKSINAAKIMLEALEREDSAVLLLILGKWDEGRSIMQKADSLFDHGFQMADANLTIPGEEARLDSIAARYAAYKSLWIRPIVDTKREGNLNWYFERVHSSFLEAKSSVEGLSALNNRIMYQTASDLKHRAHRAIMPGVVAIVAALMFALLFYYFVNIYVVSPIVRITNGIKDFNEHRTSFNVPVESKDELSDLAGAISTLCSRISVPEGT